MLLCHVGEMTTQRYLARAACVCVAWRNEAHADAHNATMRFDKGGPHVARALRRCAAVVQELHVPRLLSDLPAGVCFPRLTLVREYAEVDVAARAPKALAALRCVSRRAYTAGCCAAVQMLCLQRGRKRSTMASVQSSLRAAAWAFAAAFPRLRRQCVAYCGVTWTCMRASRPSAHRLAKACS